MSRVQFLAIPTARRPAELRRAVDSYGQHLARHGQSAPIIVFHSPHSLAEQTEVADALRGVLPGGGDVSVVGLTEKLAMAKELKRASGVSPELLEFGLFARSRQPPAAGANRNAILLWAAGGGVLCADDDTLGTLYAHPEYDPGAPRSGKIASGDPSDYFVPETGDVSPWLIREGGPQDPAGGLLGAVEEAWAWSARQGARASLVVAGLAGDCGWGSPFGFWGEPLGYLLLGDDSLERLTVTQATWEHVLRSRRLVRAARETVLARSAPAMTTCIGIDAEFELPPFLPLGRGQDLLFAAMVERLSGAPSAWLPIGVGHEPATARRFHDGELLRSADGFDLCSAFFALLESLPQGADLTGLGRHLSACAATDDDSFGEMIAAGRRELRGRQIEVARARARSGALPAHWAADVERYCDRAAEADARPDAPWILDSGAPDSESSIKFTRDLVGRYGALCEAWPALFKAARARNAGVSTQRSSPVHVAAQEPRCSPYQTWLWRSFRLDPSDASYVTFRAYRGEGEVRTETLEAALRALIERHQMLRSKFRGTDDGDALLDVCASSEFHLDLRPALSSSELEKGRRSEHLRPFNLRTDIPIRATLVPLLDSEDAWELWLAFHHIALDGASEEIFWRELSTIERNLLAERPATFGLPDLHASFLEIAEKQRAALARPKRVAIEKHWKTVLDGAPSEMHLSYRSSNGARDTDATRVRHLVPESVASGLRAMARREHCSVAPLLLIAWQAVLSRWSRETDVVVAIDHANRWDEADEQAIGLFMTPMPIRVDVSADATFRDLLHANRMQLASAFEMGPLPLHQLVQLLSAGRRRFDLFHALFTHLVRSEAPRLSVGTLSPIELEEEQAGFELGLIVEESKEGFALVLLGRRALFDAADLSRLGRAVVVALETMSADAAARLSDIDWLSPADASQLALWNQTVRAFPDDQPLTEVLRKKAGEVGDAIVVERGDERLSYRSLWRNAETLARRLRALGVTRDERVALYLSRSPRILEAMLGVLLAGGGYLPLDPAFPEDRVRFMVEDSGAKLLLTTRSLLDVVPEVDGVRTVCIDDRVESADEAPAEWRGPTADSLAYVLYTSGSTGKPKGVEITHRSLVNFLHSMAREPGLGPKDVLLALTTLSFDIAGLELWLPQLVGARIALAGQEEAADGDRLRAELRRTGATVLQATPSTWRSLIGSGWTGDTPLTALVGGEALPPDLALQLASTAVSAWNLYGPTETTIWSSTWQIPKAFESVRIGRPIANTELRVLDERRRQLPLGVTGDLYIGGVGVARGYLGREELTRERFVELEAGRGNFYATGDRARWLPDGTLEFLGRGDDQLKLRGYRIEAGEVEAAILKLPEIAAAAVALEKPTSGDARLVAYVVPKPGVTLPSSADLRARLRSWLLDHMLPYHFVSVTQLPLTPNGKLDRRKLSGLFHSAALPVSESSEPLSALERDVLAHFSHVLGRATTVDEDFFEAGGDSLAALRLIGRLGGGERGELTTGALFLHSTPRRMAAHLTHAHGETKRPQGHLVLMRQGQGGAETDPVFFLHPIGGQLAPYVRIARHLDPAFSMYGLQATSSPKREYASVLARCSAYADEIEAAWKGQVTLGGYSLGGVLALATAAELRRRGRAVRIVFLLDAGVPARPARGLAKFRFRATEMLRFSWKDRRIWFTDQVERRFLGKDRGMPEFGEGSALIDAAEMRLLNDQVLAWTPPSYPGKVVVFSAARHVRGYSLRPTALGWEQFCLDLELVRVDANHSEMVVEPHAPVVAREISSRLVARAASSGG